MDFKNQVVIVTGASSGIGYEAALAYARRGATVVAVARREERLKALVDAIKAQSPRSSYLCGDLGDKAFAQRVIDETMARYGRLDILVNNAAVPMHRLIYRISAEDAERVMRVNFLSCLWTCFAAIPHMMKQGSGSIVNVSSFATKIPPAHETIYVASKCALDGFTRGLWNDLQGSGIRVSLVHPGPIATEIWEKLDQRAGYQGKLHPPSEVASEILRASQRHAFETVAPRRNFTLGFARLMNLIAPSLVRIGSSRLDPIKAEDLARARDAFSRGQKMGNFQ